MSIDQVRKELIAEYKQSLKPSSKFFNEDLQNFTNQVMSSRDLGQLKRQLANLRCLAGKNPSFNKEVEKMTNELDRGGMYDVRSMKNANALD